MGSPRRLRWVKNSARGHQEQEQRALTPVLSLGAIVFPSTHNGLPRRVIDPPPPCRSAPFCKRHFQHQLTGTIAGQNSFRNRALFIATIKLTHYPTTETHVPAPAKIKTSPTKIAVSIFDKVQGVRMWITPVMGQNCPEY